MEDRIGNRMRAWRRRRGGMTQQALADLAGLSQGYVSQVESGKKPLDRKSTQVAIASALNISVSQLLGCTDQRADPVLDRASKHIPAIRAALVELGAGERHAPRRDRATVRQAVRQMTYLGNAVDYATAASLLPDLLLDVGGHGDELAPEMVEVTETANGTLKALGHIDLAKVAAEVGLRAAERYDDSAWRGEATYSWIQSFPPESAALGARIAARLTDDLQGSSARDAQEVYGQLHLSSALQAAVASRPDEAHAHLAEAANVARVLGEPEPYGPLSAGFNGNWFGITNVKYWRVAIAAELGDPATAIAVADHTDLSAVPVPNRHVYFWTDLARALAAGGKDRDAMLALAKAERAAPQHFRRNPVVRDLVATLINRAKRRSVAGELTTLARKLGLDVL
jgi:transcriptional regulator with XRE-family HTH domain